MSDILLILILSVLFPPLGIVLLIGYIIMAIAGIYVDSAPKLPKNCEYGYYRKKKYSAYGNSIRKGLAESYGREEMLQRTSHLGEDID